jgi:hypothetical protein
VEVQRLIKLAYATMVSREGLHQNFSQGTIGKLATISKEPGQTGPRRRGG